MLRISKLADYGTMIMNHLASHPQRVFSANEVAVCIHVEVPTVSKILKILHKAGLVASIRGAGGGYHLTRSATEITVAQVIAAIDGAPALTECCQKINLCAQGTICTVKDNWKALNQFITSALQNLTLADMSKPLTPQVLIKHLQTFYS